MKKLLFLLFFTSICLGRTIDSLGVFPFGPDLDLRKDLTIEDIFKKFGTPEKIDSIKSDLYVHYPNMTCYIYARKLHNIEIINGKFQNLNIGMSKRKIKRVYGESTIVDTFPNEELQEFGYYDDQWIRYIVTLFIKDKKLAKISIRREDDWL